ncbi:MAG: 23S rRNA (adenine(2503)-C(2))-methyltransferase RlmN, partial [Chloroflexi bacterium]|nr:23S rRNA (adenine(2503)-C(2))-methyltransferase RlmN [Chloroflexota bacterium]
MATSTASTVGTTTTRRRLLELSLEELEQLCVSLGQPAFRARQLFTWIYSELVFDFDQMANLPKAFRDELSRTATILPFEVAALQHTRDELTHKVLFRLADGKTVETVLMLYDPTEESRGRRTVCVSSQVGCAIGCPFCATGQSGFGRNLTAGEIVAQVLFFARLVLDHWESAPYDERPITNIVFMGQGEPLLNLKEMAQAIERLNSPYGFNLGARQMTVSTSGIIPKIHEFARLPYQLNLAISLHAPNDELR